MKKIFILGILLLGSFSMATGFPEYYYEIKKGKQQKREFINILKPLIEKSNMKIVEERIFVKSFFEQLLTNSFRSIKAKDLKRLLKLSKKYRIESIFDKNEYLSRIDIVPVSLGITQGAIESGWGKSRFVREANNVFGHWTWGKIGIVPQEREEGKTHKIRIFKTLQSSVDAYVLNLNRHSAYENFRKIREQKREKNEIFSGVDAANTMLNYSQLGEAYVEMLQNIIKRNKLLYYDKKIKEQEPYNPAALIAID